MSDKCELCGSPRHHHQTRSAPQFRRYHKLIDAAFLHWPERHNFRPKSRDHLRYWLTVEAGKFDVAKNIRVHSVDAIALQALLEGVLRTSDDERLFIDIDGDLITVKRAHSIKTTGPDAMPQREFAQLCSEVDAVVSTEIGIEPEKLLKAHEAAA